MAEVDIPRELSRSVPVGILIGGVGGGKTTLYNALCDRQEEAGNHEDSQTTKFVKAKTTYKNLQLCLYDGPGLNSHKDVYKHSYILVAGLTYERLNTVFIVIPWQPRVRRYIVDTLAENLSILKEEHWDMVVPIITKMDNFEPDAIVDSLRKEKKRIKSFILEEFDFIKNVLFYMKGITQVQSIFTNIHKVMSAMPKRKIDYTDEEFCFHFSLREWKGLERTRMSQMKKRVKVIISSYTAGINSLLEQEIPAAELKETVYASLQLSHKELEAIYDEFVEKFGKKMIDFSDFAASIELKKIIMQAQDEYRNFVKQYLPFNPDDTSDWRNSVRRCQYCNEIWVKVEGCDGTTTCGNIPGRVDQVGSYFRWMTRKVGGVIRFTKVKETGKSANRANVHAATRNREPVGCGKQIVWKNQEVVSQEELEKFYTVSEIGTILKGMRSNEAFVQAKKEVDRSIADEEKFGGYAETTLQVGSDEEDVEED